MALSSRFFQVFVLMMLMFIISPIAMRFVRLHFLLGVFTTAVFVFLIFSISPHRRTRLWGIMLAGPALVFSWTNYFVKSSFLGLLDEGFGILFISFAVFHILAFVYREKRVTTNLIWAAAVAYLLLAVGWAHAYGILETLHPGSFVLPEGQAEETRFLLMYYSVVTITTLGYGDITPLTLVARSLSAMEALVGQLYIAVQIAWLVGLYVAHSMQEHSRSPQGQRVKEEPDPPQS